jgi:hypothetical protein
LLFVHNRRWTMCSQVCCCAFRVFQRSGEIGPFCFCRSWRFWLVCAVFSYFFFLLNFFVIFRSFVVDLRFDVYNYRRIGFSVLRVPKIPAYPQLPDKAPISALRGWQHRGGVKIHSELQVLCDKPRYLPHSKTQSCSKNTWTMARLSCRAVVDLGSRGRPVSEILSRSCRSSCCSRFLAFSAAVLFQRSRRRPGPYSAPPAAMTSESGSSNRTCRG